MIELNFVALIRGFLPNADPGKRISRNRQTFFSLLTCSTFALMIAGNCLAQTAAPISATPVVEKMSGTLAIGQMVKLYITGWKEWNDTGNALEDLRLFIDGRKLKGIKSCGMDLEEESVRFLLKFTDEDEDFWDDLLRRPSMKLAVSISAGPSDGNAFPTKLSGDKKPYFSVVRYGLAWLAILLIGGIGYLLVHLARTTSMIRDKGPSDQKPQERTYSLARTQAAFWFFLIISGYLVIWVLTGAQDTITPGLLGLMGISAGTMLSGAIADQGKTAGTKPGAPEKADQAVSPLPTSGVEGASKTQGFLPDILRDSSGYNFHRFQIVVWTVVLGIIFISSVYNQLQMPEFSNTLLGLMGISSGTYVSLKLQEK